MKHPRLKVMLSLALLVLLAGCARRQEDGSWPAKNITIIVPFKAGGGFDLQARLLAPFLEKYLANKVNVVIENVAGAGGKMAAVELARSAPNGYTIGVYDNTAGNLNNPFSPPREVIGTNGSMRVTDEMFQLIITFLPYQPGDENTSLAVNSPAQ